MSVRKRKSGSQKTISLEVYNRCHTSSFSDENMSTWEEKNGMKTEMSSSCDEEQTDKKASMTSSKDEQTLALSSKQSSVGPTPAQVFNSGMKNSASEKDDVMRLSVIGGKLTQNLLVSDGESVPPSNFGTEDMTCSIKSSAKAENVRLRFNDTSNKDSATPTEVAMRTEGTRYYMKAASGSKAHGEICIKKDGKSWDEWLRSAVPERCTIYGACICMLTPLVVLLVLYIIFR